MKIGTRHEKGGALSKGKTRRQQTAGAMGITNRCQAGESQRQAAGKEGADLVCSLLRFFFSFWAGRRCDVMGSSGTVQLNIVLDVRSREMTK